MDAAKAQARLEQLDRVERHIREQPSDDGARDDALLDFIAELRARIREALEHPRLADSA
jgi:hypothetical protein